MSGTCCQRIETPSPRFIRRCLNVIGWLLPSALLALMPKCPVCLAAYIALGTGLGVSFTAAAWLRTVVIIACVASLLSLTGQYARRFLAKNSQHQLDVR